MERWLTPMDIRLLARLSTTPNVVRASRSLGIPRDRAVYRLARLRRLYGGPVVRARRGGPTPGETRLTALGRRLLRDSSDARPESRINRFSGIYRGGPSPTVDLGHGRRLQVSFRAREGAPVEVAVDPGSIVVARRPAELSARNALPVTVQSTRSHGAQNAELRALWRGLVVRVGITPGSIRRLALDPGARVYLYVKAVSVRRVATRGSPRS
jgi:molybdopterin-binding protein/molybdate transport repressor ModE-like protein